MGLRLGGLGILCARAAPWCLRLIIGSSVKEKFSSTHLSGCWTAEWRVCGDWRWGASSAPDLFPPEEGPFVLKPDNGAARRAKPLVKTCLTSHAREIGEKAWPRSEWRSSERPGKPITFYTHTTFDLSWTPLRPERPDEPQKPCGCGCCWQGPILPISATSPSRPFDPDDPTMWP